MRRLGHTEARLGGWFWKVRGGETANCDELLDAQPELVAEQEEIGERLKSSIELQGSLGKGGFGKVYRCVVHSKVGKLDSDLVIKLPLTLLDAGVLAVPPTNSGFVIRHSALVDTAELVRDATDDLLTEFKWFEQIYEPPSFFKRFGGGKRGEDITLAELRVIRSEMNEMRAYVGRNHIHRILHFDESLPAILSERCDGTLKALRLSHPALFTPKDLAMTETWLRAGEHIASAMQYMRHMGVVHIDIKPDNVFYRRTSPSTITCLVSDFGLCLADAPFTGSLGGTLHYFPAAWPFSGGTVQPMSLSVYNFAATMVLLLRLPRRVADWPLWEGKKQSDMLQKDIALLKKGSNDVNAFFPDVIPSIWRQTIPEWRAVLSIMGCNYATGSCDNYALLEPFLPPLAPPPPAKKPRGV
jgi:serine/threonine protein kinase